jgi:hypothetical protein
MIALFLLTGVLARPAETPPVVIPPAVSMGGVSYWPEKEEPETPHADDDEAILAVITEFARIISRG